MFARGPDMPDPATSEDDLIKLFDGPQPGWTIIVISSFYNDAASEGLGGTLKDLFGGDNEIIYSMENTRPVALAHEVAHLAGNTLPGDGDGPHNPDTSGNYIMTRGAVLVGTRSLLTDAEARKYDGGP
jgi:hypothetical protein